MRIDIHDEQEMTYVDLMGRLDTSTSPELQSKLMEYYNKEGFHIVLNFAELEYVSSAGLRVLLMIQKKAIALNGKMILRLVNSEIREVFEMTGFLDFLIIE